MVVFTNIIFLIGCFWLLVNFIGATCSYHFSILIEDEEVQDKHLKWSVIYAGGLLLELTVWFLYNHFLA